MVEPENGLSLIHEIELTKVVTNNPTNENRGKFMNIMFCENNFILTKELYKLCSYLQLQEREIILVSEL